MILALRSSLLSLGKADASIRRADELHRQEPQALIGDIIDRSGFDSPSNYYKAKRKYGE